MRRPDPGAGSRRRRVLALGAALLAGRALPALAAEAADADTPAGTAPSRQAPLVRSWMTVTGGRLAGAIDPLGFPKPGSIERLVRLLRPVTAAARASDVVLADAGLNAVYRYDLAVGALVPAIPGGVVPGMRLRLMGDQSLLVLEPQRRRIARYTRGGALVQAFADDGLLVRPVDFALDERAGLLFVADGTGNRIVAFRLAGLAATPVFVPRDGRDAVASVDALAAGHDRLYLLDGASRRVTVLGQDGTARESFGHVDLKRPVALGVDAWGRVYVADAFDDAVRVFERGVLAAMLDARLLGVTRVSDIAVHERTLVVVDSEGAQVRLLRISQPAAGGAP